MSEPEYMTGRELRDTFSEMFVTLRYDRCISEVKKKWDEFAELLKVPRPPKPKTLEQVYDEWNRGVVKNESWEDDIEHLRVLLNEARQKLDGGL